MGGPALGRAGIGQAEMLAQGVAAHGPVEGTVCHGPGHPVAQSGVLNQACSIRRCNDPPYMIYCICRNSAGI